MAAAGLQESAFSHRKLAGSECCSGLAQVMLITDELTE